MLLVISTNPVLALSFAQFCICKLERLISCGIDPISGWNTSRTLFWFPEIRGTSSTDVVLYVVTLIRLNSCSLSSWYLRCCPPSWNLFLFYYFIASVSIIFPRAHLHWSSVSCTSIPELFLQFMNSRCLASLLVTRASCMLLPFRCDHYCYDQLYELILCQLAVARLPGSGAAALIGILAGQIYRSDLINLKSYRLGPTIIGLSTRYLSLLLGFNRPPRRSNRAFPDASRRATGSRQVSPNDEVVTTARPTTGSTNSRIRTTAAAGAGGNSVVRDWVQGLTGRGDGTTAGVRIPPDNEITELTNMFPDISREAIIGALQRRYNIFTSYFQGQRLISRTVGMLKAQSRHS